MGHGSGRYPIPASEHRVEEEIKGSRFITILFHAPDEATAQAGLAAARAEHPGATHHCWAWVLGPPGRTDRAGASDDGEPSGTAGQPMLRALVHSGVGEVAAVVVRHYGGTKLGTGGLVRAYGGGVARALEGLALTERVARVEARAQVPYGLLQRVERLIAEHDVEIAGQDYGVEVSLRLMAPRDGAEGFERALIDATGGQVVLAWPEADTSEADAP